MDRNFLGLLNLGADGIYSASEWGTGQEQEILLRKKVASTVPVDLMGEIAVHHSVPVMDFEVRRFIKDLPVGAIILDIGGCWGWHWRNIANIRPDLTIVIMDLVRENLLKAKHFLSDQIGKSVFLVHGDGTKSPFPDETFDGCWAVQVFQHIPQLENALLETRRVMKKGGKFSMYNLNNPSLIRSLYKLLGRRWIDEGVVDGMFFLRRSGTKDAALIRSVFGNVSGPRYSEVLFTPEVNFHRPSKNGSLLGKLDCRLTGSSSFIGLFARQSSFSSTKQ